MSTPEGGALEPSPSSLLIERRSQPERQCLFEGFDLVAAGLADDHVDAQALGERRHDIAGEARPRVSVGPYRQGDFAGLRAATREETNRGDW
jgi:hypothetical protein